MIERVLDAAARQTGIDRIELRRRNMIRPEKMPYTNAMQKKYDTGRFESVLDQALVLADWPRFAAREAATKKRGWLRGRGIVTFIEWTGADVHRKRGCRYSGNDGAGIIEIFPRRRRWAGP